MKKFKWFDNHEIRQKIIMRSKIVQMIREFFLSKDFIETETPILIPQPGMEPNLEPFKTKLIEFSGKEKDCFLITSPEYAMKKLLVAGLDKIFQITKSFRNCEETSKLHNPEFSILEWYRANADYTDIMKDCQDLVLFLVDKLYGRDWITYQGQKIDLSKPWIKKSVSELFLEYGNIDLNKIDNTEQLKDAVKNKGYQVNDQDSFETLFFQIFLNEIEPNLPKNKPVIVYDYPKELASLSKLCDNKKFAQRFELYIAGIEVGNAFSELTDPKEQEKRFLHEQETKKKWGKQVYEFDKSFISALKLGMPESGGIAVGVDRLAMILLDAESIEEVIWFPQNKTI